MKRRNRRLIGARMAHTHACTHTHAQTHTHTHTHTHTQRK